MQRFSYLARRIKAWYFPEVHLNFGSEPEKAVYKQMLKRARKARRMALLIWLLMITAVTSGIIIFMFSRLIDDFSAGLTRSSEIENLQLELTGIEGVAEIMRLVQKIEKENDAYFNPESLSEAFWGSAKYGTNLERAGDQIVGKLSGLNLTPQERTQLEWARTQSTWFLPEQKFDAASELAHRVDARRMLTEGRIAKLQEQQASAAAHGDSWLELIPSLSIRIGIVVLLLFLVRILVPVHRYHMKLGSFYDACADAVALRANADVKSTGDLIALVLPDYTFDKEPSTPTEMVAGPIVNELLERLNGKSSG